MIRRSVRVRMRICTSRCLSLATAAFLAAPASALAQASAPPTLAEQPEQREQPSLQANSAWELIARVMRGYEAVDSTTPGLRIPPNAWGEYIAWWEYRDRLLFSTGSDFCARYPKDARCWEWLMRAMWIQPDYYVDIQEAMRYRPSDASKPRKDSAAIAHWRQRIDTLLVQCAIAANATSYQRALARFKFLDNRWSAFASSIKASGFPHDRRELHTFEREVITFAEQQASGVLPLSYPLNLATRVIHGYEILGDTAAARAFRQQMIASKSPILQANAQGFYNRVGLSAKPVEMRFTAVDGRVVDLAALRGKVVLLSFWASTWCGACKAEEPHLKRVYQKYRDRGFEIVGIALENHARDRAYLVQYVKENDIPWPQYFDGKGVETKYAQLYGISSIPRHLFLDREGRMVEDVSGMQTEERLEEIVRRLLGLSRITASAKVE